MCLIHHQHFSQKKQNKMEGIIAVSIPIIITIGAFTMILGMRAMDNKERMAMIERGMEPPARRSGRNPSATLRSALFFIGAGLGLFFAIMLSRALPGLNDGEVTGVYFALISIGAGAGLLTSFLYDNKKEREGNKDWNV